MKHYEVIILGGGIVGLTTALLLAQCDIHCALIEQKKITWENQHPTENQGYDLRVFALTEGSRKCFEALDIWPDISAKRLSVFQAMHIWDSLGFGKLNFEADSLNQAVLGYIVENRVIQTALLSKISKEKGIDFFSGVRPQAVTYQPDKIILTLADENQVVTQLSASLIIGADGSKSWLRETVNIKSQIKDYQQNALIAHIKTEIPHQNIAWQRFLPQGPLAALPLPHPHHSSIVWSHSTEDTESLKTSDTALFEQNLAAAFDYRLGKTSLISDRQSYPLYGLEITQMIADRIVFLGEAAHVIHPLAGLGLNLGLNDAVSLASILFKAKQQGFALGAYSVLRRFERQRKAQVWIIKKLMEVINQIFSASTDLKIGLRSLLLSFTEGSQLLKRFFMSGATLLNAEQTQFLSDIQQIKINNI